MGTQYLIFLISQKLFMASKKSKSNSEQQGILPQSFNTMAQGKGDSVVKIPPFNYLHVLDQTSHVTRTEVGPQTFVRKDHEVIVTGPAKMIIIPPAHYCTIANPSLRNAEGEVLKDAIGQVKLDHAETEIRLQQDPFPLYPGEIASPVVPLTTVD